MTDKQTFFEGLGIGNGADRQRNSKYAEQIRRCMQYRGFGKNGYVDPGGVFGDGPADGVYSDQYRAQFGYGIVQQIFDAEAQSQAIAKLNATGMELPGYESELQKCVAQVNTKFQRVDDLRSEVATKWMNYEKTVMTSPEFLRAERKWSVLMVEDGYQYRHLNEPIGYFVDRVFGQGTQRLPDDELRRIQQDEIATSRADGTARAKTPELGLIMRKAQSDFMEEYQPLIQQGSKEIRDLYTQ